MKETTSTSDAQEGIESQGKPCRSISDVQVCSYCFGKFIISMDSSVSRRQQTPRQNAVAQKVHYDSDSEMRHFKCTFCNAAYKYKTHLRKHVENVHEIEFHECGKCLAVFPRKDTLQRHANEVHRNKRPNVCDICGCMFKRKDHLRRHHRSVHNSLISSIILSSSEQEYSLFESSGEPDKELTFLHVCEKCPAVFPRKDTLQRHTNEVHRNERPYVCNICGCMFKRKDHLKRHHRLVHDPLIYSIASSFSVQEYETPDEPDEELMSVAYDESTENESFCTCIESDGAPDESKSYCTWSEPSNVSSVTQHEPANRWSFCTLL